LQLSFPPWSLFETRRGAGAPVVLLHGLSGSSRWWDRNVEALAERYLVAAIDLVGFGKNTRFAGLPQVLPSFQEVTALLARYLETFGEPVHLVGHSMGALLWIRLAAERPDLVRSLVLVDAAGMPFTLDPRPHLRPLPKPPFGGVRIARVLLPDAWRAGPTSVAVATARVLFGDARDWMHALDVPTLLVWGENDPLTPLAFGEAMQREIRGAKLVVLPRAAHVSMYDRPEEFNRVVGEFLAGVEPVTPREGVFSWGISGWTNGIAHRQAGRRKEVVLVHGLGMSSAYFVHFARALHARGVHAIAPDLPGFGESNDAPAGGPRRHAEWLAQWADANAIRDATWVGHSIGCNAVAELARIRPDLVRRAISMGPLWTRSEWPRLRTFAMLALDALRESLPLYRYVLHAYWRVGIARWWGTWTRFSRDLRCTPSSHDACAGVLDPLPDRTCLPLVEVPGAHACHFSHPDESADFVAGLHQQH
jgi:pimeloyl-ACP methyl ester carboxylesterase